MRRIKSVAAILCAAIWISLSEFFRNNVLLKKDWTNHYQQLGLEFPSSTTNGVMWGVWSLCFATGIFLISKRYNLMETSLISWFMAFVMMWIAIGNLDVLPYSTLLYAIPLSIIESLLATLIIKQITK